MVPIFITNKYTPHFLEENDYKWDKLIKSYSAINEIKQIHKIIFPKLPL